jgi:hypothetical protein
MTRRLDPPSVGLFLVSAVATFWALSALASLFGDSSASPGRAADLTLERDLGSITVAPITSTGARSTRIALKRGEAGGVVLSTVGLGTPRNVIRLVKRVRVASPRIAVIALGERPGAVFPFADPSGDLVFPGPTAQGQAYGARVRHLGVTVDLTALNSHPCSYARGLLKGGLVPTLAVPSTATSDRAVGACVKSLAPQPIIVRLPDHATVGNRAKRIVRRNTTGALLVSGPLRNGPTVAATAKTALQAGAQLLIVEGGEASTQAAYQAILAAARGDEAMRSLIHRAGSNVRTWSSSLPPPGPAPRPPLPGASPTKEPCVPSLPAPGHPRKQRKCAGHSQRSVDGGSYRPPTIPHP